jgi:hypothetical protein
LEECKVFEVSLGNVVNHSARFVALWWDARAIPECHNVNFASVLDGVPQSSGVYAISGRHDASSGQSILYIGKANDLSTRIVASVHESLSEVHAKGQRTLFSDVWDLTVRWARASEELITAVESLLIMSHSPLFNSQGVRRTVATSAEHDLVIMNAGRKGPLLPVVAGAYQAEGWHNLNGTLGP